MTISHTWCVLYSERMRVASARVNASVMFHINTFLMFYSLNSNLKKSWNYSILYCYLFVLQTISLYDYIIYTIMYEDHKCLNIVKY